jgi:hypothetical protein
MSSEIATAALRMPFPFPTRSQARFLSWTVPLPTSSTPDLSKKIPASLLDPSLLEGVFIPSLVASPFVVNKAYAKLIFNFGSIVRTLWQYSRVVSINS